MNWPYVSISYHPRLKDFVKEEIEKKEELMDGEESCEILNYGHDMADVHINSQHLWFLLKGLHKSGQLQFHLGRGRGPKVLHSGRNN